MVFSCSATCRAVRLRIGPDPLLLVVVLLLRAAAGGLRQEIAEEVMAAAAQLQQTHADDVPGLTAPAAIVACSALTGGDRVCM